MRRKLARTALAALACAATTAALPAPAAAAPAPAWSLWITPLPANFSAAAPVAPEYLVAATDVGAAPAAAGAELKVTLPAGFTPLSVKASGGEAEPSCSISGQEAKCTTLSPIETGQRLQAQVTVSLSLAEGTYATAAQVSGGGAEAASATALTPVGEEAVPFAVQGLTAPLTDEQGLPATLAGSHPFQQTLSFNFPTREPGEELINDGFPRDVWAELPRGLAGDPGASPVLCTEAQLTGTEGCPPPSQVGVADVTTALGRGINGVATSALYDMVPQPGSVAELGTDVAGAGLYVHTLASVRSEADYGVRASTPDLLALGTNPIFGLQAQVWGDPSSPAYEEIRECKGGRPCHVDPQETALLTAPADCPGTPTSYEVAADTWEEPFPQFPKRSAAYASADLAGNPVHTEGCGELSFEPQIEAAPTTDLADSPAGLDFALHQPQNMKLGSRSSAPLRDAAVRFPAGLAVNPSQASGLGACTEAQIGFLGEVGEGPEAGRLDFSATPQSCPEAAKIGTLQASSPALVQRNADHEVLEEEVEGQKRQLLRTLHGSVYLAQPYANPFGSLLAVYLAVEDPESGIVAKLAGEGQLDPATGQISTYFERSPELPIEDIHVHLFGGDRGALITPPACGAYSTEADLTPWSSPEGEDAFPQSSFQVSASPLGGPCPQSVDQQPAAPLLSAGTESPQAGAYSPLVFKLSRADGTQRIARIEATLPSGLLARLAGVGECSEAQIAKARSREAPQMGAAELADPSCPAASQIGTLIATAGAGPTPYRTTGRAYLAGPYAGAPLSVVAIVPAVAGPFDLGTVVSRSAVRLDPTSGQGSVVSDPLPQILHGVPVDLRSVSLIADRPQFTLNPTSCAEKSFAGQAISPLGVGAPIAERFQVDGCAALPFEPRLSARLYGPTHRGAHPRLRAVLKAKPGEANLARTVLTLPRSEFIDQAHFRTICTRVQYAAAQCPKGSIYGHVKAFSPLLDYPLEGPVYLRSSNQELPDVVFALRGPAYQPLALDVVGHVDSVKGRLRTTFAEIPDAPLTKAIVTMQGSRKGLFQNSTEICRGTHRATLKLDAQSGRLADSRPPLRAKCKHHKRGKRHAHHRRRGGR